MANQYRYDGRVAVVTGAGGGLGRTYALLLASRGAAVVVNDLGGAVAGGGSSSAAADKVVAEIVAAGGKAVANYDSVNDGEKIIDTAIKAFGRVDILINNAGILRDKSFKRMTDADWDLIYQVHVRGTYKCTKAAWEHMKKNKYGRIVNTSSAAGIYGNFGQTNYSAAKLGIWGFSQTIFREGAKDNILCNTIAPIAGSRMTETVMPKELVEALRPEFVAPLVAYLVSEQCKESGGLFELGAGLYNKLRWELSKGTLFKLDDSFTPSAVAAKFNEFSDFSKGASHPIDGNAINWLEFLEISKTLPRNQAGPEIRFDGRVAVVTGAGSGLGRAYAHLFAKLGASVVVNDLGGSAFGAGQSSKAADVVVEEIRQAGGKAVANYNSVEDGDKVIETAIKAFGRVDILVNNAGILRDKSFQRMTDDDFDIIQRIHVRGTYKVTKAAWEHMVQNNYGRIINTTSTVGVFGNFGQANYSAAKAAILGFSLALAQEGAKNNIVVSTIAPNAGTRLTATVMPDEIVRALSPEFISPLVVYLGHESHVDNGGLYVCGAGWIGRLRRQQSFGVTLSIKEPITIEDIAEHFHEITHFDERASYPTRMGESTARVMANLDNVKPRPRREKGVKPNNTAGGLLTLEEARKLDLTADKVEYTDRDVILYALGVGASRHDLNFVYENASNFAALPTYGVIPSFNSMTAVPFSEFLPKFDFSRLLHGEQYLELHQAIPTSGVVTSKPRVVDILDKGKDAVVVIGVDTRDEQGNLVCYNEYTNFIRGSGGFGGQKERADAGERTASNKPPSRAPDVIYKQKTSEDQAALYRLSGDRNPLHLDPDFAAMGGFDTPILHGLCSFGIAAKNVLQAYGNSDPATVHSIRVRFSKHVFPGETLQIEMWREGDRVIYQVRVVERDVLAITNAAVRFHPGTIAKTPVLQTIPSKL